MVRRARPIVLLALVAAALTVRLTVRDGVRVTAPFFYATPPGVLVLACAVALTIAARRRSRALALAAAAMLAVCGADLVASSCFAAPESRPGALRGMFWNVFRGHLGWDGVAATVRESDPDVAWFDECFDDDGTADAALRRAMPEHSLLRLCGGMVVLVRGEAQLVERRELPASGRAAVERIVVRGRTIHALHVDLDSNPLLDRRLSFDVLDEMKTAWLDGPLLVVGDFNTPRDSACFDAWRGPLVHAFETAGRGFAPTWPVPCPVLALDHVWASRALTFRTCEHGWTPQSDHRPVVFTFD